MEKSRVAVFEDSPTQRLIISSFLKRAGHEVVATASDLVSALDAVGRIADGEIGVDVLLLDGNLSPDDISYDDARYVLETLRAMDNPPTVIGFSSGLFSEQGINLVADTGKDPKKVLAAIEAL